MFDLLRASSSDQSPHHTLFLPTLRQLPVDSPLFVASWFSPVAETGAHLDNFVESSITITSLFSSDSTLVHGSIAGADEAFNSSNRHWVGTGGDKLALSIEFTALDSSFNSSMMCKLDPEEPAITSCSVTCRVDHDRSERRDLFARLLLQD